MSDQQTTAEEPTEAQVEAADDDILLTVGHLDEWRVRKTKLDTLLGEAGREAAMLARKIQAAEYLMKVKAKENCR